MPTLLPKPVQIAKSIDPIILFALALAIAFNAIEIADLALMDTAVA